MSEDLISRDAVLDACSQSINILDAMSRIEDLPSVKPNPCEDAISRQAAHEAVYSANGLAGAMKNIDSLPPVTPKPCEDAISRQAAIVALDNRMSSLENVDMQIAMGFAKGIICELPSVTPKQRTGHWIKISECPSFTHRWECSSCGCCHRALYDFCPSCGAKMVEPQESEG